jgi:hypothetical protein
VPYVVAAGGVAMLATGLGLYGYGDSLVPEGCSASGCQLRFSYGSPSDGSVGKLGKPCGRDFTQDGCAGSPLNLQRQLSVGASHTWETAGMIVGAGGAVALVASVIFYLRQKPATEPQSEPATARAIIVPFAGDKLAGAAFTARF